MYKEVSTYILRYEIPTQQILKIEMSEKYNNV